MGTGGIDIDIKTNMEPYLAFVKQFPFESGKALNKALNRVGKSAETAIIREITSIYNIKRARLKAAFFIINARADRHIWTIFIKRRKNQPNITSFGAKETAKAVTVSIIKGKRQKFKGAFISTFKKSGKSAAFMRVGDGFKDPATRGKFKGKISSRGDSRGQLIERERIEAIYGPQIIKMVGNKNIQLLFEQVVIKRSNIEIPREFKFLADKIIARNAKRGKK